MPLSPKAVTSVIPVLAGDQWCRNAKLKEFDPRARVPWAGGALQGKLASLVAFGHPGPHLRPMVVSSDASKGYPFLAWGQEGPLTVQISALSDDR